jgi:UDP:flavonoid glycosyltransferase YjiC (YdhE family)
MAAKVMAAKVIVAAAAAWGHLVPLLAVAADLVRRGHEVLVQTGPGFALAVRRTGASFAADFDGAPGLADQDPERYAGLRALLARFPAVAVITGNRFPGAVPALLGQRLGAARPVILALGIGPLDDAVRGRPGLMPDHFLQLTVPGFEFPGRPPPSALRFAGYIATALDPDFTPPGWWADLHHGRPVVTVTQGTAVSPDWSALLGPTLRALAGEDITVVAATARAGGLEDVPAALGEVPGNARLGGFLPFDRLLPLSDVLVTNGGYGGVQAALHYGVPLVVAAGSRGQSLVAARVEGSGTGVSLGTARPGEAVVRAAVNAVLDEPQYREHAWRLRVEFARYRPLDVIAGLIEHSSQVT